MNNYFVQMAINRYKIYREKGINDVYFLMMKEKDRNDFDKELININHPLAYEPGTNEYRFKTIVKNLIKEEKKNV